LANLDRGIGGPHTEPGKYSTASQTPEDMKLTAHVDAETSQVDGAKMMMKSPGVLVPMTGATSVVEIELVKADQGSGAVSSASSRTATFPG
jgi:hypothetical protein